MRAPTLDRSWRTTLDLILRAGNDVAPRGKKTVELRNVAVEFDARRPVVVDSERKLNYKFMAAEAAWILAGRDDVEGVALWNERIRDYSDDGRTFFGAYGPRLLEQVDYVAGKVDEDRSTRQATMTFWRPNPPSTRDVPCTVAASFYPRERDDVLELDATFYMRSQDAWLGLPYDGFNFAMIAHLVVARANALSKGRGEPSRIAPGVATIVAGSEHLYDENVEAARALLATGDAADRLRPWKSRGDQRATPRSLYEDEAALHEALGALRDSRPGSALRWWEDSP